MRLKFLIAFILSFLALAGAQAQTSVVPSHVQPKAPVGSQQFNVPWAPVNPLGYCQLTSVSTATGLSSCSGGIPTVSGTTIPASMALIQTESVTVRYRDDGTNPTASVGFPLATGVTLTYIGNLSNLEFIPESSSATLDVLFYQ